MVLITGDSSGIGRATAERLAAAGWRVFGASRRDFSADGWTHLTVDVTDEASVDSAIDTIVAEAGGIDAVVHCAGQSLVGAIEETTLQESTAHFDLNFFGAVRVVRAALPVMRRQGSGKIIVIGSIGGLIGLPYQGYYSASKFALDGLVEAMRPEVSPFGIDATVLHPGDINTEIGENRVETRNTSADSPYHDAFRRAVAFFAEAEQNGTGPDIVARHIERLLGQRRLPVRGVVGKTLEKLGVVGKRLLTSRQFEAVMALAYGPGPAPKK